MKILSKRAGLIFVLMMSTLFLSGCVRDVTLEYSIAIIPKEGEIPKNVTVYLPFPVKNGKPCKKIFTAMKELYQSQIADDFPDVTFELISTKYGKMLKIHIPALTRGIGVHGEATAINTVFNKVYPQDKYILSTMERKVENGEKKSYVHIYSEFENGTGFILRSLYDVTYGDWGFTQAGGGGITLIGTDKEPPDYIYGQPYSVEINRKGWIKLPIW
ncbi:MAG: hypothetical protein QMD08_07180 [Actinomycetota bacterium]|nr:hypothetical protein [Actinomycetota bacterium]